MTATATVTRLKTQATPAPFKFTEATVRDLPTRRDRYQVADTEVRGLYVRVTPAGVKTFCVVKHSPVSGKVERVNIGPVTDNTVKMARDEARRIIGAIASRQDVGGERRKTRATITANSRTVRDMLGEYATTKRIRGGRTLSAKSLLTYTNNLELLLGKHFDGPVDRLTPDFVYSLYTARLKPQTVERNGRTYQCGSLVGALGAIRALLAILRFHEHDELAAGIKRRIERVVDLKHEPVRKARVREEDAQQVAAWFDHDRKGYDMHSGKAIQHEMFMLALSTGLRLRTMRELTWDMVNFRKGSIVLPARVLKNYKDAELPLPPRAAAMLAERKKAAVSEFVFATQPGAKAGIDSSCDWKAGLPHLMSLHDARKAFTKALNKVGAGERCMAMLLTHAERGVTGVHYLQTEAMHYAKESAAAEAWTFAMVGNKAVIREQDEKARKRWAAWGERRRKTWRESAKRTRAARK